jgi:hypothetical protein
MNSQELLNDVNLLYDMLIDLEIKVDSKDISRLATGIILYKARGTLVAMRQKLEGVAVNDI